MVVDEAAAVKAAKTSWPRARMAEARPRMAVKPVRIASRPPAIAEIAARIAAVIARPDEDAARIAAIIRVGTVGGVAAIGRISGGIGVTPRQGCYDEQCRDKFPAIEHQPYM